VFSRRRKRSSLSPSILFAEAVVKKLSTSFFLFAGLQVILFCVGLSLSGTGLGGRLFGAQTVEDENLGTYLLFYGGAIAILAPIPLILAPVAGFALRAGKGWGRVTGMIAGILSLLDLPIGTIFGVYWLVRTCRGREAGYNRAIGIFDST
jgi:hypothetical protein